MTNNQTSLKLNKAQQQKVAYILKYENGYIVGTEADWVLYEQISEQQYKTLLEVKQAINNIVPYFTAAEKQEFKRSQAIRSLRDDYRFAKSMNDLETMQYAIKELRDYGIEEDDI